MSESFPTVAAVDRMVEPFMEAAGIEPARRSPGITFTTRSGAEYRILERNSSQKCGNWGCGGNGNPTSIVELVEQTKWWHDATLNICDGCIQTVSSPGWVYFIRAGDYVKIGYSLTPEKRLREIATGSPVKPILWAKVPGGKDLEQELHRRFAGQRSHLEWFVIDAEIEAFTASLTGAA